MHGGQASLHARAGGVGEPTGPALVLALARAGLALFFAVCAVVFIVNLPAQAADLRALSHASLAPTGPAGATFAAQLRSIGVTESRYIAFTMTLLVAVMVVNFLFAGLILWRRVDDRMALLAATTAAALGVVGPVATVSPANSALVTAGPLRLLDQSLTFVALLSVCAFNLLFPSGTFVPRWTRWLLVAIVPMALLYAFLPSVLFAPALGLPRAAMILSVALCVIYTQIYRYRRVSSAVERQQTKWVSLAFIASLTFIIVETIAPWLFDPLHPTSAQLTLIFTPFITFCVLVVPFCLGIAITRFHLWNIDVIIRRTLICGSLTAVLAAAYFSAVLLAQVATQRFTGFSGQQPIVIVGSTLLIAALVAPLRRRIQALIDRAFYRGRYDAALTLAAFGAKLRTATDLEALREDLISVVRQTMRPEHITLWLAKGSRPAMEMEVPTPHANETDLYPTRASVSASVASSKSGG